MNKGLFVAAVSLLLTACGGGSDSGSSSSTNSNTTINNPTLSKLQVNSPEIGQILQLGSTTSTDINSSIVDKKYYGKYAYCYDIECNELRVGELNFVIKQDGSNLKLADINVDMLGKIYFDNQEVPHYQKLSTGGVGLANSSLTLKDTVTKRYNLKLAPANSTEDKLPTVDIQVYFNNDGMHMAGAEHDHLFVAQQMQSAPIGWGQLVDKQPVLGTWKYYETDVNLRVTDKSSVEFLNDEILKIGNISPSSLLVSDMHGKWNGYYANIGAGYLLGSTDDGNKLKKDGSNYDGIGAMMITAPDNQFAIGYDGLSDSSFLLFR
ncbi:hypothetical protein GCM10010099_04240 [Streptomyces cinereus]|nr:hypothetical protein GCM10010099_04240 [Streptomyces cinereus]